MRSDGRQPEALKVGNSAGGRQDGMTLSHSRPHVLAGLTSADPESAKHRSWRYLSAAWTLYFISVGTKTPNYKVLLVDGDCRAVVLREGGTDQQCVAADASEFIGHVMPQK